MIEFVMERRTRASLQMTYRHIQGVCVHRTVDERWITGTPAFHYILLLFDDSYGLCSAQQGQAIDPSIACTQDISRSDSTFPKTVLSPEDRDRYDVG